MHASTSQATAAGQLVYVADPLAPFPAFGQRPSKPLEPSKRDLITRLKECKGEIFRLCRETQGGQTSWPDDKLFDDIAATIRALASLYERDRETIWQCIIALQNRCKPVEKLRESIEALVDRAAKLRPESEAIRIQKQGIAGNEAAKKCFEDLEKCRNGQSKIASIDWEEYREILEPLLGESCAVKAAQICIDWLSRNRGNETPWSPLAFEIARIGNSDLALRLMSPNLATGFDNIRAEKKESRFKQLAAYRKRKSRLREKVNQLAKKESELVRRELEMVRRELEIMDADDRTGDERDAVAKRLMRYTHRTPGEWRTFFVTQA